MGRATIRQADRFYRRLTALVRAYQFRDRDHPGRYGISVSEWYPLELLDAEGPMPIGEVARRLAIELSTMTRIIDRLEQRGAVTRQRDAGDRRVCNAVVTRRGSSLVRQVQEELIAEYREVLDDVPSEHREEVIRTIERLATNVTEREGKKRAT